VSRFRNILARLQGQLWILPALISIGAAALAIWLLTHGASLMRATGRDVWWLYSGDAGTARGLLSGLLSGMITMTSLIVSVTFVILTLAANQLGPRLIGIFVRDRQIQSVLGLFLGTILYVIIVFRTLDDTLGPEGVPHLAVTVASALTVLCVFALLFYIHKIARSIIADNVVEAAAMSLRRDVRQILRPDSEEAPAEPLVGTRTPISLGRSGYVQVVDYDRLVELARGTDAVLEVKVRAGHYLLRRGEHVVAYGGRPAEAKFVEGVRAAFTVAAEPTPAQDLEHGIRQLVEIALRALSPGINDQFTAFAVVDRLGGAFEDIFERALRPKNLQDKDGRLRVVANRSDPQGLVDAAFDPIRQAGANNAAILIRIADTLGRLAPVLTEHDAAAVLRQLDKLRETLEQAGFTASDRNDVLSRIRAAKQALLAAPALVLDEA
jgi:uncharacterized membrane protein